MSEEELLYNEIYEKTKDCGRTQFIKLLQQKETENKQLKQQLDQKNKVIEEVRKKCELEISASSYHLEQFKNKIRSGKMAEQIELNHKVAHKRILNIIKESRGAIDE